MKRIADVWHDLRHPWWTFTREVALIHCQRTGQKLVPVLRPTGRVNEDISAAIAHSEERLAAAIREAKRRRPGWPR